MLTRAIRPIAMLLGLALLTAALPAAARAQTGQRCFAETNFCIEGRIREFWEQNGGLPVFGLPIAPQGEEQIEGKPFQVQWFERNRLELHPENQRPYDVLIGRLGADRLGQQGRDWFAFPQSPAQDGCRFFAETGHNVCGDILAAWRASGLELDGRQGKTEAENLALFGLPLSDAQTETLSDGKSYTVQWFERGRFELHPENQPPYNVLLGLLGGEVRTPPAPPAPTPAPVLYDGSWSGQTGQKKEVSFEVAGNALTSLKFKSKFKNCDLEITTTGRIEIQNNSFTSSSDGSELTYTLKGTFISPTIAEGTLDVNSSISGCGGTLSTGWKVTKK